MDTAGHSVFVWMFKCRVIFFQVTLLLIFLFLNKKFCIDILFFFICRCNHEPVSYFVLFLETFPVTEIAQPGS